MQTVVPSQNSSRPAGIKAIEVWFPNPEVDQDLCCISFFVFVHGKSNQTHETRKAANCYIISTVELRALQPPKASKSQLPPKQTPCLVGGSDM